MPTIILFAPLLGALIAGFGWRLITEKGAMYVSTALLILSAVLSWVVFLGFDGPTQHIELFRFIESGDIDSSWAIRLDRLTAIMLIVINTVSALVHVYSIGYMAHDENFGEGEHYKARFFAYLSLFTFMMLSLVTADNLIQIFFGWEGVGLASYLLIGFYYKKPSAGAAAIKAFIVNRVGDFGFLIGIFALFFLTSSVDFDTIFQMVPQLAERRLDFWGVQVNAVELAAIFLFIGAMGKSAQLLLHTWLPDAMEGPTPVSALIHAATMVTAGVFLLCRMSPLYEFAPETKSFIVFLGATTAFFAATVGLVQNDIKRVIAYSTCSQLGYMFVAAGVGVYPVAMFHLLTHAFFKAMLFLSAGSVITAMHHEQDMRNYGGLRKKLPLTFWAMMVGTLAITGVGIPLTHIGFAGFLSKDAIVESAWAGTAGGYAFWMLVIAALFTSFYSWRLMFMTFFGTARGDKHKHEHAHESKAVMTVPLGILGLGAILAGMVWYGPFFGNEEKMAKFFNMPSHEVAAVEAPAAEAVATGTETTEAGQAADGAHEMPVAGPTGEAAVYISPANHVIHEAHEAPAWVKVSPFIAMLIGFVVAWVMYIAQPKLPAKLAASMYPLYKFLLNKWYFDELYDFLFRRPALGLARFFWKKIDEATIDGAINGLAFKVIPALTRLAGRMQSGYLFHYAFTMVIGIVVLMFWVVLAGGSQ
ncbi:NADH-quinone oxidoreductase subunit L [Thioclava litoralis]|uniref:NADH-quinone oxidoreductase subunit L n=1 Tax=Thioclava litoralis TaxID=3076557 RepID=A0ABZ1DYQ1_9RHOB|nr:NADH-quinone oxidoreductase subunit L [Thioclava sp. FTW29]